MKFDYVKVPLPVKSDFFESSILKPIILSEISNGNSRTKYAALIDSGADFCIFDAEIGEQIGLDVRSGKLERFGGIQVAEASEAFMHTVVLTVGGWDYKTTIGFSYGISRKGYGILGQKGFFDMFVVKFDYLKEKIELIPKK